MQTGQKKKTKDELLVMPITDIAIKKGVMLEEMIFELSKIILIGYDFSMNIF